MVNSTVKPTLQRKSLHVDLHTQRSYASEIPSSLVERFLGGSSLALAMCTDRIDLNIDPLSPSNPLYFNPGLLTGTIVPAACKGCVASRSPLTGLWSQSTVGGNWPARLSILGWAQLLITGKADYPVYIVIDEEGARIEDASHLWGLDTYEVTDKLASALGGDVCVAAIGPAGERLIPMASIMVDGWHARAAGRTGMGAVMGSKNLKAIALLRPESRSRVEALDVEAIRGINKMVIPRIREKAKGLTDYGTAGGVVSVEAVGDLPIKNWTMGSWPEGARATSGQAMVLQNLLREHYACFGCPIRCGKSVEVRKGPYSGTVSHGPEYETCAGFGANCLNQDLDWLVTLNDYCNRMGIDTISASSTIAFALECYEKGLITRDDVGFDLVWGDGERVFDVLRLIIEKRGIGEVLCQGTREAAKDIGKNSIEMAVQVKGLEVAYHDPRAFTSMAVNYATAFRGGCHLEALTYFVENKAFPGHNMGMSDSWDHHGVEEKARLAKTMQDYMVIFDSLGLCKFLIRGHVTPEEVTAWVNGFTGWNLTGSDLLKIGEDIFDFKRGLNVKMGVSRKDDILPPRLLTHDRLTGGAAGSLPHLGKMLCEYYKLRGWSPEGVPRDYHGDVADHIDS